MTNLMLYLKGIEARISEYMAGTRTDEDGEAGACGFMSEAVTEVYHVLHEDTIYNAYYCGGDLELYGNNDALPRVMLELREFSGDPTAVLKAEAKDGGRTRFEFLQLSDEAAEALISEFFERSGVVNFHL